MFTHLQMLTNPVVQNQVPESAPIQAIQRSPPHVFDKKNEISCRRRSVLLSNSDATFVQDIAIRVRIDENAGGCTGVRRITCV